MSLPLFPLVPFTKISYTYSTNALDAYGSNGQVGPTIIPASPGVFTLLALGNVMIFNPDTGSISCTFPDPTNSDGAMVIVGNADTTGVYSITLNGPSSNTIRNSAGTLVSSLVLPYGFGTYQFSANNGIYQVAAYNIADMNGVASSANLAIETTRAEAAEALLAPIASPTFTGIPAAPTAAALTSTTQVATTAFTTSAVGVETTRATTAEALLAPLASPALTGNPTATTQTALNNSTRIATTAYTDAAVGVETTRATNAEALKANLASPTFTGVPAAPTATALTSTTQLATTAFTTSAVGVETTRATTAEALLAPLASPTFTGTVTQPTVNTNGTQTFTVGGIRSSVDPNTYMTNTNNTGYTQTIGIYNGTTYTTSSASCTINIPGGVYGTYLIVANFPSCSTNIVCNQTATLTYGTFNHTISAIGTPGGGLDFFGGHASFIYNYGVGLSSTIIMSVVVDGSATGQIENFPAYLQVCKIA
jgi:hypothetical protein